MASSSSVTTPKPAPWKPTFLSHLSKMDSPEFVLSTVAPSSSSSSSSSNKNGTSAAGSKETTPYVPRARYCIFRGFWAELPENKHSSAAQNPRAYETEMPTFTTDIRMHKIADVFASGAGHADAEGQMQGSGGGGPVEAVWWVKETGTQWRVKGRAYVVGEDIEGADDGEGSSGVRTVKSEVGGRMRTVDEAKAGEWSWGKELTAHFGNMSPGMRGSFRAPPPGTPKTTEHFDDENYKPGMKVDDLHDKYARKNFRVVVIKPEEVEQLDLSDPAKAFRHKFTYNEDSGEWKMEELWP